MKRAESQVVVAVLMPHAPVLVPGVGGDRARAVARTIGALTTAAGRIVETRPDAVVVVSPHASRRGDRVPVYLGERVRGSLEDFGAPERSVDLPVAGRLVTELERDSRFRGSLAPLRDTRLDHGALVPLWHVQEAGWNGPVLVLGPNTEDAAPLEALGRALAAAASRASMSIALVASGDLSHRLRPGAPSGYDPRAGEFDRALMDCIREGAFGRVRDLDPELRELAAEDAVEPLIVVGAAVDWDARGHEVLSYEGPFGVGYGVAILYRRSCLEAREGSENAPVAVADPEADEPRASVDLVRIARRSLENAFRGDSGIPAFGRGGVAGEHRAVFVTLRDRHGELRGCVGHLNPRFRDVATETWHLARDAAFRDARFGALAPDELASTRFEVSVLSPLEEVTSTDSLDPRMYGVVVEDAEGRRAALLPDVEGIDTVARQLTVVRRKAGIAGTEAVRLWRFTVRKFRESDADAGGGKDP